MDSSARFGHSAAATGTDKNILSGFLVARRSLLSLFQTGSLKSYNSRVGPLSRSRTPPTRGAALEPRRCNHFRADGTSPLYRFVCKWRRQDTADNP